MCNGSCTKQRAQSIRYKEMLRIRQHLSRTRTMLCLQIAQIVFHDKQHMHVTKQLSCTDGQSADVVLLACDLVCWFCAFCWAIAYSFCCVFSIKLFLFIAYSTGYCYGMLLAIPSLTNALITCLLCRNLLLIHQCQLGAPYTDRLLVMYSRLIHMCTLSNFTICFITDCALVAV